MTHVNNALAQQLEALVRLRKSAETINSELIAIRAFADRSDEILAALRQPAPASGEVEPVAWMYSRPNDVLPPSVKTQRHDKYDFMAMRRNGWTETPLYTADMLERLAGAGERGCTCHPDDDPPQPCPKKYALTDCKAAQPTQQPNICEHGIRHPWACHECDDVTWAKHTAAQPTQQPGDKLERGGGQHER